MSLWTVMTIPECIQYVDNIECNEVAVPRRWVTDHWEGTYSPELLVCPKHYCQKFASSSVKFIYDPGTDSFRMFTLLTSTPWPGWDARRYDFDAATGEWTNSDDILSDPGMGVGDSWVGVWGIAYSSHLSMGSYNKIYASRPVSTSIVEVSASTLVAVEGGWSVSPSSWSPSSLYSFSIVNRVGGYFAGVAGSVIDFWQDLNGTPEKFASLNLPGALAYMCWEGENYLWTIGTDGTICKIDYQVPRYEMISQVQSTEETALGFAIAFDTKRHRLCVFRVMPDASDGAAQHQLEFYYPVVQPQTITAPVPITSLKATGKPITFVSHILGDVGEGCTPIMVTAEVVEPANGSMKTSFVSSELNGRVTHKYQAPESEATDTIQLSAEVEDR